MNTDKKTDRLIFKKIMNWVDEIRFTKNKPEKWTQI